MMSDMNTSPYAGYSTVTPALPRRVTATIKLQRPGNRAAWYRRAPEQREL
jgi:hypothetical protein